MINYDSNTFKYSNHTYTVAVNLYTKTTDPNDSIAVSLDAVDIDELVYESKLNDLLVQGHIIYTDKYAMVDKLLEQHYCYCDVLFAENKNNSDNNVGMGNLDEEKRFMHSFIISNIKVLARTYSIIKYKIDIISLNWFKCAANISFSNYGGKPQPVFDILKSCMAYSNLAIDDNTFGKVKTPVSLNYITQRNDNMFTTMNYLLHKLYYTPDKKDDSLKFVVYCILDLKDSHTFIGAYSTIISFFKTNTENLIQQEPTNIGSFKNAATKPEFYQNVFDKHMYGYDYNHDKTFDSFIKSEDITTYLNSRIDNNLYEQKYFKMFNFPNMRHEYTGMYWDNQFDVYNNSVEVLEENNSLILNVTGDIRRQPGSLNNIMLDRSMKNVTSDDKKELEKIKKKYKAYEGIWLASKVRTIVCPAKPTFRQLIVLFRNFMPKAATSEAIS